MKNQVSFVEVKDFISSLIHDDIIVLEVQNNDDNKTVGVAVVLKEGKDISNPAFKHLVIEDNNVP